MEGDNGMASIKQSLEHSAAEAKKLAITIPSTVTRNTLRCAEEGDSYARNIYDSNGNYAKLAGAFTSIANICDKTLKNDAFTTADTKVEIQELKRKTKEQANACKKRMEEMKSVYNVTADIAAAMNK